VVRTADIELGEKSGRCTLITRDLAHELIDGSILDKYQQIAALCPLGTLAPRDNLLGGNLRRDVPGESKFPRNSF